MGRRGNRINTSSKLKNIVDKKRPHDNSKHRELCLLGANYLKKMRFGGVKYVSVELVTQGWELADIWGTTGFRTYLIEVKVSRSDFQRDFSKDVRKRPNEGAGNFRYYLCPYNMISSSEVPNDWGLLYEKDGVIFVEKEAKEQEANNRAENAILCSIMRREGIKAQVFNYRK